MQSKLFTVKYFIAITLIAAAFIFSALIWTTPIGLGHVSILLSSIFALLLSVSWGKTFLKNYFGLIILLLNSIVSISTCVYVLNSAKGISVFQQYLNVAGNGIAALVTIVFGTILFIKLKSKKLD